MRLLIGIPAYNESGMIGKVLLAIPKSLPGIDITDVIVVDDGSNDKTGQIVKNHKVRLITHLINRGLGGALRTIIDYARINAYDLLITMDADGQHDSVEINKLIKPLLNKKADIVIGSRWSMQHGNTPWIRFIVNQLANAITWILFGIWTTDSQSGFRALNRNAICNINIATDGMEVSSEIFKEININKLKFKEVPIKPIYSKYSITKGQRISNAPEVLFQLLLRLLK